MTEPVPTREQMLLKLRDDLTDILHVEDGIGEFEPMLEALNEAYNMGLATVEHNARREAEPKPPVYPELFNGQNVKQPTPSILVEIAPSGFAERITYGQVQWDSSRVVKYVLAPPDLPFPPPGGVSDV